MQATVLITGNSSGLGLGLTEEYLSRGETVQGLSRSGCPHRHDRLLDARCDLSDLETIDGTLGELLTGDLKTVILNAGVLGEIRDLSSTDLDDLKAIMDVNLWANKLILDALIRSERSIDQLVMISSGAAVNGHRGWGGYALSKAALNMLAQLYAHEMPDTQVLAMAPGLVATRMQDYLYAHSEHDRYPSLDRLAAARGTPAMPGPREAARTIIDRLPDLRDTVNSGGFVDIRER